MDTTLIACSWGLGRTCNTLCAIHIFIHDFPVSCYTVMYNGFEPEVEQDEIFEQPISRAAAVLHWGWFLLMLVRKV